GPSFRYSTFPSAFTVTTGLAYWRPLLQVQNLPLRLHSHHGTGSLEAPPSGTVPSPPPSPSPRDWLTGGPSFRYRTFPSAFTVTTGLAHWRP
ncbi:MAG: hypothetical protein ACK55Z_08700, partial [bacterium]